MKLVTCLLAGTVVAVATMAHAQEDREPRLWNPAFVYGSTAFDESDAHQTFGMTFRFRLGERLNLEPEFRYMRLPSTQFESSQYRREGSHSDTLLAANLVYDFRNEAETRFVPYMSVGAGWGRTTSSRRVTELAAAPDAVPVFPPAPSRSRARFSRPTTGFGWARGSASVSSSRTGSSFRRRCGWEARAAPSSPLRRSSNWAWDFEPSPYYFGGADPSAKNIDVGV